MIYDILYTYVVDYFDSHTTLHFYIYSLSFLSRTHSLFVLYGLSKYHFHIHIVILIHL